MEEKKGIGWGHDVLRYKGQLAGIYNEWQKGRVFVENRESNQNQVQRILWAKKTRTSAQYVDYRMCITFDSTEWPKFLFVHGQHLHHALPPSASGQTQLRPVHQAPSVT